MECIKLTYMMSGKVFQCRLIQESYVETGCDKLFDFSFFFASFLGVWAVLALV